MGTVLLILIGLGAGVIARLLFLHDAPGGWLLTLLLGVAGAAFAGVTMQWVIGAPDRITAQELSAAILGASWLLIGFRLDVSRSLPPHHDQCRQ